MANTYATSSASTYDGYLIRINGDTNYIIPNIQADSYKVTRNIQDLDSTRNANGKLVRNALTHVPLKVEFTTTPMLTDSEWAKMIHNISSRWTIPKERKCSITCYVPETNEYVTQDVYMSDIEISIYGTYGGQIHYNAIGLTFIGY